MSKQPGGTSFHMENFKRRSRYALVFILLILAFGLITVLNINNRKRPYFPVGDPSILLQKK